MRKYLLLIFLFPIFSNAQIDSNKYNYLNVLDFKSLSDQIKLIDPHNLSIGFQIGTVFDVEFSDLDIDQWSTDLKGNFSENVPLSFLCFLEYDISSSFSLGINYGSGNIYGENTIMYHEGSFSHYNLYTKLNIIDIRNKLNFYAIAGVGIINSKSSRSFIYDDVVFLNNETESIKTDFGFGISYDYNDRVSLKLERSYNRVADDGFDGWDDGTGNDKFIYTSLGISYKLADNKNSISSLDQKLVNSIDSCFDCDELDKRISFLENSLDSQTDTIILSDKINYDNLFDRLNELEMKIGNFESEIKENLDFTLSNDVIEDLNELLFYPSDIDTINTNAYPRLDSLISFLNRYPSWDVLVVGYTDTDNTIEYNIDLSKRRASKVRDYLKLKGLKNKITIQFKGETSPFVPNTSSSNKQLNRRTEIIIIR